MDMRNVLDLGAFEVSLYRQGMERLGDVAWIEESCLNPESFWAGLTVAQRRLCPWPVKSVPLKHYDFYHDIAVRLAGSTVPALRWPSSSGEWQELSYADLGRRAEALAAAWVEAGAEVGKTVALVYFPGDRLTVALLAALKLGLNLSLLPPEGRRLLRRRLEALAPDLVAAEEIHTPLLMPWRDRFLPEEPVTPLLRGTGHAEVSAAYSSGRTAALLFDPCSSTPLEPRPLTADALYLCALRDGLLSLGLRPGDAYAAPGFDLLETQPALLLAGLLNGATFIHMPLASLEKHPEHLTAFPLKVLGLSRKTRDLLLRRPVALGKTCRHWFRHPSETVDLEPWSRCVKASDLTDAFASNLLWNASWGGCLLISARRRGTPHLGVLPAPGVPWRLGEAADAATVSLGDWGLLVPCLPGWTEKEEKEGRPAPILLGRHGNEWLFMRPPHAAKNGHFYPGCEVALAAAEALTQGFSCCVVTVPTAGAQDDPHQVLLVFTAGGGRAAVQTDTAAFSREIHRCIEREMGADFQLDRVEFVPLLPRLNDEGKVDDAWCADQYLSGRLQRKTRHPIFRTLALLKASL